MPKPEDLLVIAFHEVGHAIAMELLDPIFAPMALQLHLTCPSPQTIKYIFEGRPSGQIKWCSKRKGELNADTIRNRIAFYLAGRAGEMIHYGKDHEGSDSDLSWARKDAKPFGNVDKLLAEGEELAFEVLHRNFDLHIEMAHDLRDKVILKGENLYKWLRVVT